MFLIPPFINRGILESEIGAQINHPLPFVIEQGDGLHGGLMRNGGKDKIIFSEIRSTESSSHFSWKRLIREGKTWSIGRPAYFCEVRAVTSTSG